MSEIIYVFNAPSLSLKKVDLYKEDSINCELHPFIKALSDAFFLSNNFRKHLTAFFLTEIEGIPYQIIFKGSELRFLGPSFFSAAHLLLRAKTHILYPASKSGKLTPGISIQRQDIEGIIKNYENNKWYLVENTTKTEDNSKINVQLDSYGFLFGFKNNIQFKDKIEKLTLRTLEIDEQVIIINYLTESVE